MNIKIRAIIVRHNVAKGFLAPHEYLARVDSLFSEQEWRWSEDRDDACEFPCNLVAETKASEVRKADALSGVRYVPWVLVLAADLDRAERIRKREEAEALRLSELARPCELPSYTREQVAALREYDDRVAARGPRRKKPSPSAVYAELERRKLE